MHSLLERSKLVKKYEETMKIKTFSFGCMCKTLFLTLHLYLIFSKIHYGKEDDDDDGDGKEALLNFNQKKKKKSFI